MTLKEKLRQVIDNASESDLVQIWSLLEQQFPQADQEIIPQKKWSEKLTSFYGSIQDESFERQPQPEIGFREEL